MTKKTGSANDNGTKYFIGEGFDSRWAKLVCNGCEASGPEVRIQTSVDGTPEEWLEKAKADAEKAKVDAIAEWNKRHDPNPWRYVARDGNPTEKGEYLVAVRGGNVHGPLVWRDLWEGRTWWLSGFGVYAYREMPDAPPMEERNDDLQ